MARQSYLSPSSGALLGVLQDRPYNASTKLTPSGGLTLTVQELLGGGTVALEGPPALVGKDDHMLVVMAPRDAKTLPSAIGRVAVKDRLSLSHLTTTTPPTRENHLTDTERPHPVTPAPQGQPYIVPSAAHVVTPSPLGITDKHQSTAESPQHRTDNTQTRPYAEVRTPPVCALTAYSSRKISSEEHLLEAMLSSPPSTGKYKPSTSSSATHRHMNLSDVQMGSASRLDDSMVSAMSLDDGDDSNSAGPRVNMPLGHTLLRPSVDSNTSYVDDAIDNEHASDFVDDNCGDDDSYTGSAEGSRATVVMQDDYAEHVVADEAILLSPSSFSEATKR